MGGEILNVFSAFGLSSSAGLNAYLPLFIVALTARYTNLIHLTQPWDVMTNGWVIATLAVLLLIEITVDKIPAVDTLNDIIQTIGRPVAGAVLFAANSGAVGDMQTVLACIAGLLVAGTVHTAKTTIRPAVTATTGGTGNWVVSIIENIVVLVGTILSILLPIVMAFLIIIFMLLLSWWWMRRRAKSMATA